MTAPDAASSRRRPWPSAAFAAFARCRPPPTPRSKSIPRAGRRSAASLRPLHRAPRRRHLRRHLGRPRFEDPQRRRHPQAVRGRHEAHRRPQPALARAAASPTATTGATASARRRGGRARTTTGSTACPPGRHATETQRSSASTSSCASAGWWAPSRTSPPTSAPAAPQEFHDWVAYCNAPAGNAFPRRRARRQRRPGALQRQVLGRRQRVVGLRRQHDRRRIRHRIPQVHLAGSRLPAPVLRRHGAARTLRRRRHRLDRRLLRRAAERARPAASASTASPCTTTPTSDRPPRTARSSTPRAGTPSCTRASASRTSSSDHWAHHGPGTIPSTARGSSSTSGATGTRGGTEIGPDLHPQPDDHPARRPAHRHDLRRLQPPRRQDRDGQRRADDQLPALALRRRGRPVRAHARLLRVRDVPAAHGRPARARADQRPGDDGSAARGLGAAAGPFRLGLRSRPDPDRHPDQPLAAGRRRHPDPVVGWRPCCAKPAPRC